MLRPDCIASLSFCTSASWLRRSAEACKRRCSENLFVSISSMLLAKTRVAGTPRPAVINQVRGKLVFCFNKSSSRAERGPAYTIRAGAAYFRGTLAAPNVTFCERSSSYSKRQPPANRRAVMRSPTVDIKLLGTLVPCANWTSMDQPALPCPTLIHNSTATFDWYRCPVHRHHPRHQQAEARRTPAATSHARA